MRFLGLLFFVVSAGTWSFPVTTYDATVESITIDHQEGHGATPTNKSCEYLISRTTEGYKGDLTFLDERANWNELVKKGIIKQNKMPSDEQFKYIWKEKHFRSFPIKQEKVERFVQSLDLAPLDALDEDQFELNESWLELKAKSLIDDALKNFNLEEYPDLKTRKHELLKSLIDPEKNRKRIQRYHPIRYISGHHDIKVSVVMDDRTKILLSTNHRTVYVLLWNIEKTESHYKTYDIRISRALGVLMNPKCTIFKKVGKDLEKFFEKEIWGEPIKNLVEVFKIFHTWEGHILPVTQNFTIYESHFFDRSVAHENVIFLESGPNLDNYWSAKLGNKKWPSNLLLDYTVALKNGKPNLDGFSSKQIKKYIEHVLSIDWLNQFIKNHPYHEFLINYEEEVSIKPIDYRKRLEILNKKLAEKKSR